MSELTEQRLEQILAERLEPFATKEDLRLFATKEDLDNAIGGLATKQELSWLRQELHESVDDLARMISAGFDGLKANDLREKVQTHDRKFHKLEEALHIKL